MRIELVEDSSSVQVFRLGGPYRMCGEQLCRLMIRSCLVGNRKVRVVLC